MAAVLSVNGATLERAGRRVLDGVSLELRAGELLALVGPNGAGKSTLLSVMAGDVHPDAGSVELAGAELAHHRTGGLARRRSVLLQSNALAFGYLVEEVVRMGRAPWRRHPEAERDDEAVASAMADAEVGPFAARSVMTLSGGESARVAFARVRAQECAITLLDEPTASLDIRHQERVLETTRRHVDAGGSAVVVLHDLNLAGAYADRIALLNHGALVALAPPEAVLVPSLLSQVYGHAVEVERTASGALVVVPVRRGARIAERSTHV